MMPILIPHWLAEKVKQKYGYLPEGFADAYWYDLSQESQARINEQLRLIRGWRHGASYPTHASGSEANS